mgnify:CR=1 FL=1
MTVEDYINNTKALLKRYHAMRKTLIELDKKRKALAVKIQCQYISPSIAKYDGAMGGGSLCSPVEAVADGHIENAYKLREIDKAYKSMATMVKAIEKALCELSEDDSKAISLHYIDGLSWVQVADKMGCSRKWCSIVGNNAIIKLSLLLYGSSKLVKIFSSKAGID